MPKIIIREQDYTTAGNEESSSFAVVVPGFTGVSIVEGVDQIDDSKGGLVKDAANGHYYYYAKKTTSDKDRVDVFDENGIYECSDYKAFKTYVGKDNRVTTVDPVAPTLVNFGTEDDPIYTKVFSGEEFEVAQGTVYRAVTTKATVEGHLVKNMGADGYKAFEKVSLSEYISNQTEEYYQILEGDEGRDVITSQMVHKGNQIAFELLKCGYTVLFKLIESEKLKSLETEDFWSCLEDKSVYDFRYITTGGYVNEKAYAQIDTLAKYVNSTDTGRGDCVALIDVDPDQIKNKKKSELVNSIKTYVNKLTTSEYSAIFAPYVTLNYNDADYSDNGYFPGSFYYLACAAKARRTFAEWYAVAGYTRGVSDYEVIGVDAKFGQAELDALEPREKATGDNPLTKAVNLITTLRGNYYLWGNRTAKELTTDGLVASHFLNIRQLCCTLKKELYNGCKRFTFDPNSDVLWYNFCNYIKPTLEKMKADQGISDYRIIKVATTKKALLKAIIRIVPIEAVEDFTLGVTLEDSLDGEIGAEIVED